MGVELDRHDAVLIVDVQADFLPGGKLAVGRGDEVVPVLNRYLALARRAGVPVYASRDWHPRDHCSFRPRGGPWPEHCIAGTTGAAFAPGLALPGDAVIISKATGREADAYSAFQGTDVARRLRESGVRRLLVGGLATDYCVLNTVLDARKAGFEVLLLKDAIRAVNVKPGDGERAERDMRAAGAVAVRLEDFTEKPFDSALLTDLYQLTMLHAYYAHGMDGTAVFELFVRKLPRSRNFMMAAGLEQALDFLERLRFTPEELEWVEASGRFDRGFVERLAQLRFTGDVHAVPEGTILFPDEPILRVTAPMPEAQLAETRLINLVHFETLVATKAARSVLAAPGKLLVDFGLRRAHGGEAGLLAARAAYIAGYGGTATVAAGSRMGIPVFGTMAHSFVEAHDDEAAAFERIAAACPQNVVLLIDTYDTEVAARKVVELAPRLAARGIRVRGVRLDSGDLAALSRSVRRILDAGGLPGATIFASGNIDEYRIRDLLAGGAPIDGFGVGTSLVTSSDAPFLDAVYKLQEYSGRARRKRSTGKATWPGRKQVYRCCDRAGRFEHDAVTVEGDELPGEPLLVPVMRQGRRLAAPESLAAIRERAAAQLAKLPDHLRALDSAASPYRVEISPALRRLAAEVDRAGADAEALCK